MVKQIGGNFPASWSNPQNTSNYFSFNSNQLISGNTAYGFQNGISYGVTTGGDMPNMIGPNLGIYPHSTNIQTGGNPTGKILNPKTGRTVNINGKIGRSIIKNELRYI